MQHDKTKFFLSIIATVVSVAFILIYCLAPATATSHPLYKLFFDCIPDTLVVLIAIPVVYWLFYRRGLTTMGDCPLFIAKGQTSVGHHHSHRHRDSKKTPVRKNKSKNENLVPGSKLDILIVAGIKNDCKPDSGYQSEIEQIMIALNAILQIAEAKNMPVVFTKNRASTIQGPAERNNSKSKANTHSPELRHLYSPSNTITLEIDISDMTPNCAALDMLISNPNVHTVYVVGLDIESDVQAVCLRAIKQGKKAVALEKAIATPNDSDEDNEKLWESLVSKGVVRQEHFPSIIK